MSKILVADDSQTIQKVVSITLANEPYELVAAENEEELLNKVRSKKYDLVLLDFNLSEKKTGYELGSEIIELSPNTKILAMLGTFDTVDDALLDEAGIQDKVVKPFESATFINKCGALIDDTYDSDDEEDDDLEEDSEESLDEDESWDQEEDDDLEEDEFEEDDLEEDEFEEDEFEEDESEEDEFEEEDESEEDLSNWKVDSPTLVDKTDPGFNINELTKSDKKSENILKDELSGWGMEIPGVIGKGSDRLFPPVIDEKGDVDSVDIAFNKVESESLIIEDEENKLPSGDDLDYPDLGSVSLEEDTNSIEAKQEKESKPTSGLISIDSLADDVEEELELKIVNETKIDDSLENEIVDEVSPDDFWALDEDNDSVSSDDSDLSLSLSDEDATGEIRIDELKEDVSEDYLKPIESIDEDSQISSNDEFEDLNNIEVNTSPDQLSQSSEAKPVASSLNEEEIVNKLKESLTPVLEELVRKFCAEQIEKVAWEVIPDLAENLIKKEIKEISDSIE